jgi:hypothetical protein
MKNFINFELTETVLLPIKLVDYFEEFNAYPYAKKIEIASETDNLVLHGNSEYFSGNTEKAIEYYHLAINKHPLNNDALQNLYACYEELGMTDKLAHIKVVWNCVKELKGI